MWTDHAKVAKLSIDQATLLDLSRSLGGGIRYEANKNIRRPMRHYEGPIGSLIIKIRSDLLLCVRRELCRAACRCGEGLRARAGARARMHNLVDTISRILPSSPHTVQLNRMRYRSLENSSCTLGPTKLK